MKVVNDTTASANKHCEERRSKMIEASHSAVWTVEELRNWAMNCDHVVRGCHDLWRFLARRLTQNKEIEWQCASVLLIWKLEASPGEDWREDIKWLRSMAPMTSDFSGFITTLTFSRKAYTCTHTHMHTHTHPHTHGRRYILTASQMRSTWSTQKDSCSTINDSHLCVFSTFCTQFYGAEKTTKHSSWRWR